MTEGRTFGAIGRTSEREASPGDRDRHTRTPYDLPRFTGLPMSSAREYRIIAALLGVAVALGGLALFLFMERSAGAPGPAPASGACADSRPRACPGRTSR